MKKDLLIETQRFIPNPLQLAEGVKAGGNIFVEGILATLEVKNGNGRYYKRELWERDDRKRGPDQHHVHVIHVENQTRWRRRSDRRR